jgi:hypothetical protein
MIANITGVQSLREFVIPSDGRTEEYHEKPLSDWPVLRARFEPEIFGL